MKLNIYVIISFFVVTIRNAVQTSVRLHVIFGNRSFCKWDKETSALQLFNLICSSLSKGDAITSSTDQRNSLLSKNKWMTFTPKRWYFKHKEWNIALWGVNVHSILGKIHSYYECVIITPFLREFHSFVFGQYSVRKFLWLNPTQSNPTLWFRFPYSATMYLFSRSYNNAIPSAYQCI